MITAAFAFEQYACFLSCLFLFVVFLLRMCLLKALFIKPPKRLDFLLVAVKPEYQSKGVFAMLFSKLLGNFIDMKLVDVESNPELEDNKKMLSQWDDFDKDQHKRRRAFKKNI